MDVAIAYNRNARILFARFGSTELFFYLQTFQKWVGGKRFACEEDRIAGKFYPTKGKFTTAHKIARIKKNMQHYPKIAWTKQQ